MKYNINIKLPLERKRNSYYLYKINSADKVDSKSEQRLYVKTQTQQNRCFYLKSKGKYVVRKQKSDPELIKSPLFKQQQLRIYNYLKKSKQISMNKKFLQYQIGSNLNIQKNLNHIYLEGSNDKEILEILNKTGRMVSSSINRWSKSRIDLNQKAYKFGALKIMYSTMSKQLSDIIVKSSLNQISQDRKAVHDIIKWLQYQLKNLNQSKQEIQHIYQKRHMIFASCMVQIIRQVSIDCKERGMLLKEVCYNIFKMQKWIIQEINEQKQNMQQEYLEELKQTHKNYQSVYDKMKKEIETKENELEDIKTKFKKVLIDNKYYRKENKLHKKMLYDFKKEYEEMKKNYNELEKQKLQYCMLLNSRQNNPNLLNLYEIQERLNKIRKATFQKKFSFPKVYKYIQEELQNCSLEEQIDKTLKILQNDIIQIDKEQIQNKFEYYKRIRVKTQKNNSESFVPKIDIKQLQSTLQNIKFQTHYNDIGVMTDDNQFAITQTIQQQLFKQQQRKLSQQQIKVSINNLFDQINQNQHLNSFKEKFNNNSVTTSIFKHQKHISQKYNQKQETNIKIKLIPETNFEIPNSNINIKLKENNKITEIQQKKIKKIQEEKLIQKGQKKLESKQKKSEQKQKQKIQKKKKNFKNKSKPDLKIQKSLSLFQELTIRYLNVKSKIKAVQQHINYIKKSIKNQDMNLLYQVIKSQTNHIVQKLNVIVNDFKQPYCVKFVLTQQYKQLQKLKQENIILQEIKNNMQEKSTQYDQYYQKIKIKQQEIQTVICKMEDKIVQYQQITEKSTETKRKNFAQKRNKTTKQLDIITERKEKMKSSKKFLIVNNEKLEKKNEFQINAQKLQSEETSTNINLNKEVQNKSEMKVIGNFNNIKLIEQKLKKQSHHQMNNLSELLTILQRFISYLKTEMIEKNIEINLHTISKRYYTKIYLKIVENNNRIKHFFLSTICDQNRLQQTHLRFKIKIFKIIKKYNQKNQIQNLLSHKDINFEEENNIFNSYKNIMHNINKQSIKKSPKNISPIIKIITLSYIEYLKQIKKQEKYLIKPLFYLLYYKIFNLYGLVQVTDSKLKEFLNAIINSDNEFIIIFLDLIGIKKDKIVQNHNEYLQLYCRLIQNLDVSGQFKNNLEKIYSNTIKVSQLLQKILYQFYNESFIKNIIINQKIQNILNKQKFININELYFVIRKIVEEEKQKIKFVPKIFFIIYGELNKIYCLKISDFHFITQTIYWSNNSLYYKLLKTFSNNCDTIFQNQKAMRFNKFLLFTFHNQSLIIDLYELVLNTYIIIFDNNIIFDKEYLKKNKSDLVSYCTNEKEIELFQKTEQKMTMGKQLNIDLNIKLLKLHIIFQLLQNQINNYLIQQLQMVEQIYTSLLLN